jgi:hypothetical protein
MQGAHDLLALAHGVAITPEDTVPSEWQKYIEINAAYFREHAS